MSNEKIISRYLTLNKGGLTMGIFSALSGKSYHLNSIFDPIYLDLTDRIKALEPSLEQTVFAMTFDSATEVIMKLFHPDTGLFRGVIKQLEKDNMRKIYEVLMLHIIIDMCTGENAMEQLEKENVFKTASVVFGLAEDKMNAFFSLFDGLSLEECLPLLWESICRLANKDLRDLDNFYVFTSIYRDSLDFE